MISNRKRRCEEAIISLFFLLKLFSSSDFAMGTSDAASIPALPAGKIPEYRAAYNDLSRFIAGMEVRQGRCWPGCKAGLHGWTRLDFSTRVGTSRTKSSSLPRNNAQVLDVRYRAMEPEGTVREFPAFEAPDLDPGSVRDIRISFEAGGAQEGRPKTLYYFRLNLYNQPFEKNGHFLAFLKGLAPLTTFMKSASCVMYDPHVSAARLFVLDQSRYVVQADKNIKPLPFGFGCHFKPGEANLMFAEKKSVR